MREKQKNRLATAAVAGAYVSIAGAGLWRAWRGKTPGSPVPPGEEHIGRDLRAPAPQTDVPPEGPQLQDLSLSTPGAAGVDLLARTAREEKKQEAAGAIEEHVPPFTLEPHAWKYDGAPVKRVLARQTLGDQRLAGWSEPRPLELPLPTFAPAIMAFGIVLFAMGLATTWYVCLVGSVVFAIAAWRWTGELKGG